MESSLEPPYSNHYTHFILFFVNNVITIKRKKKLGCGNWILTWEFRIIPISKRKGKKKSD